jgi:hypothetical protein
VIVVNASKHGTTVAVDLTTPSHIAAENEAAPVPPSDGYDLPNSMMARALFAFFTRRRRNTWRDATTLVNGMDPQPVVQGISNVPQSGPFVIMPNHYERKDKVWVGWGAMVITAAIARERDVRNVPMIRWVMTDTWADCFIGPIHVSPGLLGWVLQGFSDVYGIIRMPAHDLPDHDARRAQSGMALRQMLKALDKGQIVAVHPEAGGFETMIEPKPGAGRVLSAFDRRGVPIIPVGVFEQDGRLPVRFGSRMEQGTLARLDDATAGRTAMTTIAALVPPANRGCYTVPDE